MDVSFILIHQHEHFLFSLKKEEKQVLSRGDFSVLF